VLVLAAFALASGAAAARLAAQSTPAQSPMPGGDGVAAVAHVRHGRSLLELEDPVGAWHAYRAAIEHGAAALECRLGLGRTHLMLGRSAFAIAYAEATLLDAPANQEAMALCIRGLIRARQFDDAVARAGAFLQRTAEPGAELLAARASSLFRVQRIDDAANEYRRVVGADPLHAEGHLRLGSGLLGPRPVVIDRELVAAVDLLIRGERRAAIARMQELLAARPEHPVVHRLLGEALFAERAATCMAATDPAFAALAAALPVPDVRRLPVREFIPGYAKLSPSRARVVDRTAAMFSRQLGKLVAVGGRHDLLTELERTTDHEARSNLRGKRTFDGRVWDDVRGVGGVQAATGIEALDDAATFGFDTLAHEVAHQAHFFTFTPLQRARIRSLYDVALQDGKCLDFYAASNEAEYFGQGVEAFASFGKRPGSETTHGHTRFELFRVDRDLHDFIAGLVDFDPLVMPRAREQVLAAAVAVALRCGRPADAQVAAAMLAPGPERDRLVGEAAQAAAAVRCH
jgi:tetratricopeptide (TPR) repeat protein